MNYRSLCIWITRYAHTHTFSPPQLLARFPHTHLHVELLASLSHTFNDNLFVLCFSCVPRVTMYLRRGAGLLASPRVQRMSAPSSGLLLSAMRYRSSNSGRRGGRQGGKNLPKKRRQNLSIQVPELCTAAALAQELKVSAEKLIQAADELGETIEGPSRPLATDVVELLSLEFGATVDVVPVDLGRRPPPSEEERVTLPLRPPVVTLMGHVDHGKTSLLDAFRGSALAEGEAGGITQSISAFTVDPGTERALTFIDTPGHELFAAMRERGARATDIVVLVVAVDAGVQPTTVQAIEYARSTGSPIVVAANKMDRDGAKQGLERVVRELLQHGVVPEDMGGDIPLVGVSAKTGLNLDELRDQILLQAEMLELHTETDGPAEGLVLEAGMQKGLGIVSNVLVQRGELRVSDFLVAGTTYGKVRIMQTSDGGSALRVAPPSTPVRISGLKELPRTGDDLYVVTSEARAKAIVAFRAAQEQLAQQAASEGAQQAARRAARGEGSSTVEEDDEGAATDALAREPKLVPALLKADSAGALEAVREAISHFPTDRVRLQIVKADVGGVSDADVQLAETVGAAIVGFNIAIPRKMEQLAEGAGVDIHTHRIIYELADSVKAVLEDAIEPIIEEKVVGTAEVQQLFTLTLNRKDRREGMSKFTQVAGCRVNSGDAISTAKVRVERKGEVVLDSGRIVSLKHFKEEVKTVRRGQDCGVVLADFSECEPGDQVTFYELVPRKPSLYEAMTDEEKAAARASPDAD